MFPSWRRFYEARYEELVLKSVRLVRNGQFERALSHYRGNVVDLERLLL